MKYLKTFENVTNIKVDVLNLKQFKKLLDKLYPYNYDEPEKNINLEDKIHYFRYNDLNSFYMSNEFENSLRFIAAYNENDILGIAKFAYWNSSSQYSTSYISVHIDYKHMGISKKILEKLFQYFSKTHPNEILSITGYSIEGWLYLRNTIRKLAAKYNIKIKEKPIEYITDWNDENHKLIIKSKDEIKKIYGEESF